MSRVPSNRPGTKHRQRLCIVVACENAAEAAQISHQVSQVHMGTLVTYRRAEDMLLSVPAGRVALIILAADNDPERIGKTLLWMRRRWPRCPITVIGDAGGNAVEMAARTNGAHYLTRPVGPEEWAALVEHTLRMHGRVITEVELG